MTDTDTELRFIPAVIKQNRGPTLEFDGCLLAVTEWTTKGPSKTTMKLELWRTRRGTLIPVARSEFEDGRRGLVSAAVVEPIVLYYSGGVQNVGGALSVGNMTSEIDDAAMHSACMEFWDWNDRARSMVREQLGWSLKRVVE